MPHENTSARFACWRQNKTYGGWYPWPDGAGQHYITGIIHPALTRLHGVPCCIILRYVKSGYGGPPYLWRPLHAAQYGAGQSDSHAPQATRAADCRPLHSTIRKKQARGNRESGLPPSLNQSHTCTPTKKRP